MVPIDVDKLWLGGGQYVALGQVDRVLGSGTAGRRAIVVLKTGERLQARRSFKALARDFQRLRRLAISRQLAWIDATHPEALKPLSIAEAAEVTGYSVTRLRLLIRGKKIRAAKASGRWVIDPGSLYLWLAEHEKGTGI